MNFEKIAFENEDGLTLAGRLELPADRKPHNFAIFAHCFTCNKNFSATRDISRALTSAGFAVLRFDFTGLGESDGNFEDTNFSGNVLDLVKAAQFLEKEYMAPSLLIGHSFGGPAVLFAASQLENVRAVVTIGAPADPKHVKHLFKSSIDQIEQSGEAVVNLSGRDFKIKKQFIDDLNSTTSEEMIKGLNKAILVLHSPQDSVVGIKNAELLYHAAKHPKSFVTLDGADHLLNDKSDSVYVGDLIASWAKRYLDIPSVKNDSLTTEHEVVASLDQNSNFTTQLKLGKHSAIADEPGTVGGDDLGPSPYEYLSAGLAACTVMTIQLYVKRKEWPVENVECHVTYDKQHAVDCENCEDENSKIDTFSRFIKITGDLDEKQKVRVLQIADKCPVHRTLHSETQIRTEFTD